jgi:hypothetical protein
MNWKRKVLTAKGHIFVKLIINYTVYCTVHKDDRKEKLIMNHEIWYVHKCVSKHFSISIHALIIKCKQNILHLHQALDSLKQQNRIQSNLLSN